MGFGFQRIIDFSTLSLKMLNDQLEQIWIKVMGGIGEKDLNNNLRNVINSKASVGDFSSLIEQNAASVKMVVGKSNGVNLIKNGDVRFGEKFWTFTGNSFASNNAGAVRFVVNNGTVTQFAIPVEINRTYTVGFEYSGNIIVEVFGQFTGDAIDKKGVSHVSENLSANTFTDASYKFNTVSNESCVFVRFSCVGNGFVKHVYLNYGDGVIGFTPNPNEIRGSGIAIDEDSVNISTKNFNLELLNEDGEVGTTISADTNGFTNIICSKLTLDGRDLVSSGEINIHINSSTGNDNNTGLTSNSPLKTIGKALSNMADNIHGSYKVYLYGGTYNENIILSRPGIGTIEIIGADATINGRVAIENGNYKVYIRNLSIKPINGQVYGVANSFCGSVVYLINCNVSFGATLANTGVASWEGGKVIALQCGISNCRFSFFASTLGTIGVMDCKGSNNVSSLVAASCGSIYCMGTAPMATVMKTEDIVGAIHGNVVGQASGDSSGGDVIKTVKSHVISTASFRNGKWRTDDSSPRQGQWPVNGSTQPLHTGYWFFDYGVLMAAVAGKTVKSVVLTVKRKSSGGNYGPVSLHFWTHNLASTASGSGLASDLGILTSASQSESTSINLPVSVGTGFANGTVKGIAIYDSSTSTSRYAVMEPKSAFDASIVVTYI